MVCHLRPSNRFSRSLPVVVQNFATQLVFSLPPAATANRYNPAIFQTSHTITLSLVTAASTSSSDSALAYRNIMALPGVTFIVNFALLAIPIGITLAVLFGIDAQRTASGDVPIYTPQPTVIGGGNPDGGGGSDNKITTKMYCQKSYGITPDTKGQEFTCTSHLLVESLVVKKIDV